MKKIITKSSEEARKEKEEERRIIVEKHTCPECNHFDFRNLINNKYRCVKCGCEWKIKE